MDFVFINAVFFICEYVFRTHQLIYGRIEYMYFGFCISMAWLLISLIMGVYNETHILSFESFTSRTVQAFGGFLLIIIFPLFFFRIHILSRTFIVVVLLFTFTALVINRFIYLGLHLYFKQKDWLVNKVAVIGYNELSKKLVDYLEEDAVNKEVIGFCEEEENVGELSRYPIIGQISQTIEVCKYHKVSEIYSTIGPEQNPAIYNLIDQAEQNCIRFKLVPDLRFFTNQKMHLHYVKEIPVFNLRNDPLEDIGDRVKKRIFDIVVSLLVTIFILSWLIPIIGLLIWLESKGPIFFAQKRSGKDNKTFYCLKFRSMRLNATSHLQQATKNDVRITKVGKFLRRTSLDEFPQFLNVLKGQMSIVGPRPHMLKHTNEYSQQINQYMIRHFMKPGITGWAQVNGYRGETKTIGQMKKRVEYDVWYMEHWNLMLDLKIIFMTVMNALKGEKNAY